MGDLFRTCARWPAGLPWGRGGGLVTGSLRPVAVPFVAAAPGGARVRARLRLSPGDEAVLRAVGAHLGSLAGKDLAARCAEGRLDARGRARSRAARKRALTAEVVIAVGGGDHPHQRGPGGAWLNGTCVLRRASLQARVRRIEARLAIPAGGRSGRTRGYATPSERHGKVLRLHALKARLARVERQLEAGTVTGGAGRPGAAAQARRTSPRRGLDRGPVAGGVGSGPAVPDRRRGEGRSRGGTRRSAGTRTKAGWRSSSRRRSSHLANRPHGRYRISCRGGVLLSRATRSPRRRPPAPSATTSPATRYAAAGTSTHPGRPRPAPAAPLDELRQQPGRRGGRQRRRISPSRSSRRTATSWAPRPPSALDLAGLPSATRDGRLRAAISGLIATANEPRRPGGRDRGPGLRRGPGRGTRAAREPALARQEGTRASAAPSGHPHREIPRPAGPDGRQRRACTVIVIDPAYTSRWGAGHWLRPAAGAPPEGDRSPRGSAGDRATRARAPGQAPRDREPDRPGGGGTASPGAAPDHPGARDRTQETRRPTRPPAATRHQDQTGLTGPRQATRQPKTVRGRRLRQDYVLLVQ